MAIWTKEENERLEKLYYANLPYPEIADQLGRSTRAIEAHCKQFINVGKLERRDRRYPVWTHEMYQKLEVMWRDEGKSGQVCAEALGVTRSSVLSAVRRRNLHRDPNAYKNKKGFKPGYETVEQKIRRRHEEGSSASDIAHHIKTTVRAVEEKMREMGLVPHKNSVLRDIYKVHPMWSMDEDARRMAFYEKFQEGWKGVQKRLAADA